MMRLILTTIMLTMLAQPVWAHQCILSGSTAEAIQSYNLCKADLANGTANHQANDRSGKVAQLQAENYALKAQLAQIKRQLLALLGEL